MSLVKKHKMTEKKLAANRRNQALSLRRLSPEGRKRVRAARLRHGAYAQAEEVALRSLGEEPAHFRKLLEGLWKEFAPLGSLEEELVEHLARATWLMRRADRTQEGLALRLARDANTGRQNRLHAKMMRLRMAADSLRVLLRHVAAEHYVALPAHLDLLKNLLQDGTLKDMGEIAWSLLYQLQPPGVAAPDPQEQQRQVLARIKAIFGLDSPPQTPAAPVACAPGPDASLEGPEEEMEAEATVDERYPNISPAEWEARERVRQLLAHILAHQVDFCEEQRQALLKESVAGPSPYERAAEIAPIQADAYALRRVQDSNLREVRRVTNLLLRVQRRRNYQQQEEPSGEKLNEVGDEN